MTVTLDAAQMAERQGAHAYLRQSLDLPEYYGSNLDALYDCLTEREDLQVFFTNIPEGPTYFARILRVFRDAAQENSGLKFEILED